jgi:hypothetical protein
MAAPRRLEASHRAEGARTREEPFTEAPSLHRAAEHAPKPATEAQRPRTRAVEAGAAPVLEWAGDPQQTPERRASRASLLAAEALVAVRPDMRAMRRRATIRAQRAPVPLTTRPRASAVKRSE